MVPVHIVFAYAMDRDADEESKDVSSFCPPKVDGCDVFS
jgi:hypothetical protein